MEYLVTLEKALQRAVGNLVVVFPLCEVRETRNESLHQVGRKMQVIKCRVLGMLAKVVKCIITCICGVKIVPDNMQEDWLLFKPDKMQYYYKKIVLWVLLMKMKSYYNCLCK